MSLRSIYGEGEGWLPVGDEDNSFKGSFDGDNYLISNLTIDREDLDVVGLFGYIDSSFMIKNVRLKEIMRHFCIYP